MRALRALGATLAVLLLAVVVFGGGIAIGQAQKPGWIPATNNTHYLGLSSKMMRQTYATDVYVTAKAGGYQDITTSTNLTEGSAEHCAVNTTSGNVIVHLPATPTTGRRHVFTDATSTFDSTHALVLNVTGGTIKGVDNVTVTTANGTVTAVYLGASRGWRTY